MLIIKIEEVIDTKENNNKENTKETYRTIDEKNRVFIPLKERMISNIEKNSIVKIIAEENKIIIEKIK